MGIEGYAITNRARETKEFSKFHHMVLFYIIVMGLLISIFLIHGFLVDARPTSAVIPAPSSSAESIFATDIFVEDFDGILDYYIYDEGSGPNNMISGHSSKLTIYAGQSATDSGADGRNFVKSRPLFYEREEKYGQFDTYTVDFRFTLKSSASWFHVFNNNHILLYVQGTTLKGLTDSQSHSLHDLTIDSSYHIYIRAWTIGYFVYIDTDFDGDLEYIKYMTFRSVYANPQIRLGDLGGDGSEDYGMGEWSYILLKGHVAPEVKFFENFNDKNAENWNLHSEQNIGSSKFAIRPSGMYIDERGDNYVDDYFLQMNDQGTGSRTFAISPYIDIVNDYDYYISLDFYATHNDDYKWFIILSDNREINLFLKTVDDEQSRRLCLFNYYGNPYPGGSEVELFPIFTDTWNYLEVSRSGNTFELKLNQYDRGTYPIFDDPKDMRKIRIGDFSTSDYFDTVRFDNILFKQQRDLGTSDGDGDDLSDDFELNPVCPLFFDDFEYDIAFEEYGWQHANSNDDEDPSIWEVDYPVISSNDPDYGITFGHLNDDSQPRKRSKVLGTNIGGEYPNMDMWLKSPLIRLPDRTPTINGDFTVVVTFWTWYDFEEDDDGGAVYLEYGELLEFDLNREKLYPANGYDGYVDSLETFGYTGESGVWKLERYETNNNNIGDGGVRLCFRVATDGDGNKGYGWYIDDVKIFISIDTNLPEDKADMDSDGLSNGQEYYDYGTNPLTVDTDMDGIDDKVETTTVVFFGIEGFADPQVRNIFIEIDHMDGPSSIIDWAPPSSDHFSNVIDDFADHDILCSILIDEGIWVSDSSDDDYSVDSEDELVSEYYDVYLTPSREGIYHYGLFAHIGPDPVMGASSRYHPSFIVYVEHFDQYFPFGDEYEAYDGILTHELGHTFKFYDYDSGDAYVVGTKPPLSVMDYNLGLDIFDAGPDDYLKGASYDWHDCLIDHTSDFHWTDDNMRYGGWQLNPCVLDYEHGGEGGDWMGGIWLDVF